MKTVHGGDKMLERKRIIIRWSQISPRSLKGALGDTITTARVRWMKEGEYRPRPGTKRISIFAIAREPAGILAKPNFWTPETAGVLSLAFFGELWYNGSGHKCFHPRQVVIQLVMPWFILAGEVGCLTGDHLDFASFIVSRPGTRALQACNAGPNPAGGNDEFLSLKRKGTSPWKDRGISIEGDNSEREYLSQVWEGCHVV